MRIFEQKRPVDVLVETLQYAHGNSGEMMAQFVETYPVDQICAMFVAIAASNRYILG